ncbi:hypothetical protein ZIOFF_068660 [Zingiber officinale]|uniref:Uncharacterized protein n=1 Tax=Zingiber officinale TaxID=94328 RepID=A0A8J5ES06_ZINOF|nr:hypothetical protein ZIOFF_068660 [Zingiber officinale]
MSSSSFSSFGSIFCHSDAIDKLLMLLGFAGAVGDGFSMPAIFLLTSTIFNDLGGGSVDSPDFIYAINKVRVISVRVLGILMELSSLALRVSECTYRFTADNSGGGRGVLLGSGRHPGCVRGISAQFSGKILNISTQRRHCEKVPNFIMNGATFICSYTTSSAEAENRHRQGGAEVAQDPAARRGHQRPRLDLVQDGRVTEIGSHDDLIEHPDSLYSTLVRLQRTTSHLCEGETSSGAAQLGGSSSMSRRFSPASPRSSGCSVASPSPSPEDNADESSGKLKPPVPSFRRLLQLNAPEWRQALLASGSATVFGAIQPLYSYALGSIVSVFFLKDHDEIKNKTRTYAFVFLALSLLSFIVNIGEHYNFGAMGEYLTKRVRLRMLSQILTFEVGWFDRDEDSTGAVCSRFANDANVVRSLPIIVLCFYARRVLLKRLSSKAVKSQIDSSKLSADAVANLRTITAFSSQERILRMFEEVQAGPRRECVRQSWFAGAGLAFSQSLMICARALIFWYGGKLIADGFISAKALFQTFIVLVSTGRVIADAGSMTTDAGSMTTDLAKGVDAVASVFAVLDRVTAIEPNDPDGYCPERLIGDIEIRGVDFAYSSRPDVVIFRDFSLCIEAGKSTALIGQSGSGKSTIIGLIERFYDPLRGTVKIDGKIIKSYNLRALRRHIGMVGQEPTLFAGSIRDNIAYGSDGEKTTAEIEAAVRSANAHEFISALKDGYEMQCGDRGKQLSGGQKQRIAIARAILKDPTILLLDEATSALDSQSEKEVQAALELLMVGRTSVVVRIASAPSATATSSPCSTRAPL